MPHPRDYRLLKQRDKTSGPVIGALAIGIALVLVLAFLALVGGPETDTLRQSSGDQPATAQPEQ